MTRSTRPTPSDSLLDLREQRLTGIGLGFPASASGWPVLQGLEKGNKKTGESGSFLKSVWVWNLPPVITCPGSTAWCRRNCYNGEDRPQVFPMGRWSRNLADFHESPDALEQQIIAQLESAPSPSAVRIHSSGDFFSAAYVDFWIRIVQRTPQTRFWVYTRSWTSAALLERLEILRSIETVQLFASWDENMPAPPPGWRTSTVIRDAPPYRAPLPGRSIICPEQTGKVGNCASCGYCIIQSRGDIVFFLH